MEAENYRGDLEASILRIDQLEHELALFRADPSYERVDVANERLRRARERRERLQRGLPLLLIGSFALTGAFALTDPSLAPFLRTLGSVLSSLGAGSVVVTIIALLAISAQGARPKKIIELERQVRLAKGDVGTSRRLRIESEAIHADETLDFDERLAAAMKR